MVREWVEQLVSGTVREWLEWVKSTWNRVLGTVREWVEWLESGWNS